MRMRIRRAEKARSTSTGTLAPLVAVQQAGARRPSPIICSVSALLAADGGRAADGTDGRSRQPSAYALAVEYVGAAENDDSGPIVTPVVILILADARADSAEADSARSRPGRRAQAARLHTSQLSQLPLA